MELNRYNNFIDILACAGRILSLTFIYQPGHSCVKVTLETGHKGPEREYKYSSTLSLTSALEGVGGQCHAWSGQVWKILPPPGFDPWTVQPIASHYTMLC